MKIFKLKTTVLLFWTVTVIVSAQNPEGYLFPNFQNAEINFKSGNVVTTKMNYNIMFRQMIYQNGKDLLALSSKDIASIANIKIGNRIFIPFEKGVCELLSINPYIVAEYNSMTRPEKVDIGRGATTSTSPTSRYSHIISSTGSFQELKPTTLPEADLTLTYYIKVKDKIKKIRNIKQLFKVFPDQKGNIEIYLSENKTFNFKNPEDFKNLYVLISKNE